MLLACLFGVVQPALACASSADCCQSDCTGQKQTHSGGAGLEDCCATQAVVVASFSLAPQPRQALDNVSSNSPAVVANADDFQAVSQRDTRAALPTISITTDQALTYLLTARLRL
jgi:hypothetical protein